MCLCVRNWQRIIRLGDVSGTTGSKQHLFQGTAGINRHDQHIPKLDKLYQINPAYGKEFGALWCNGNSFTFGHIHAAEVIIAVPIWEMFKTQNVRVCGISVCVCD